MAKWTKEELLCNARGLDDGYLFIHSSFPLAPKIKSVLQNGKTAKSPKVRLSDVASYGCQGFTGSLRPPLSNEIHPVDEDVVIDTPSASSKAEFSSHDNLFTEQIHTNESLCVSFTEPAKLSHKSILLPGAVPPPTALTNEDRQIRRPRLNRGGGTIANMGTSNGQSYKSGYGSMNISQYERNLAQRTQRGNQMYQAGTRAWGAMEPTPKRPRIPSNPYRTQAAGNVGPPPPQNRPPWQYNQQQQSNGYWPQQHEPPHRAYHQQQSRNNHPHNPPHQPSYNQRHQQRHQPGFQQNRNYHAPHNRGQEHLHRRPNQQEGPSPSQRQGFNFRSMGQSSGPPNRSQNQGSNRVNANVMNSLKAQLANTLKHNRRANDKR